MHTEWISVIGTISGAIVGALLGSFLTRKKKKRLSITLIQDYRIFPYYIRRNDFEYLESARVDFNLLVYNGADIIKLINSMSFEVENKKGLTLFNTPIKNLDKAINFGLGSPVYENFGIENIEPFKGIKFNCSYSLNKNELLNPNIHKFLICYYDEKGKRHKLSFPHFKKVFEIPTTRALD